MNTRKQCCILRYVDDDKKTYNPGLIMTENATDDEISEITCAMQREGRNVRIFSSHLVDDVSQLPPLDQPIGEGIRSYTYDPFLIW